MSNHHRFIEETVSDNIYHLIESFYDILSNIMSNHHRFIEETYFV